MIVRRLFQSSAMNPAMSGVWNSPSGVEQSVVAPEVPEGGIGTTNLPPYRQPSGAYLVTNNGTRVAQLWFTDGVEAAPSLPESIYTDASSGTLQIAPGTSELVLRSTGGTGCGVAYTGGPLSIIPGTQSYAVLLDPADHPLTTVGM